MSKFIVIHHAHHADEGVYRLVFARQVEHRELRDVPNPQFDPEDEGSQEPTLIPQEIVVGQTLVDPVEVVWDAGDERWQKLSPEEIATQQRQIVKEAIDRRVAEQERAGIKAKRAQTDLDGVGSEL